jgi:diaminopimelate epimerase
LKLEVKGKQVASVTVDMGEPVLTDDRFFIPTGSLPAGTFVSMGNPHYVVFTDEVDAIAKDGPALECHPAFPQRCNIEYASVQTDGTIRMRVWERGSGITMACGTGACATAVAAVLQKAGNRRNTIVMDGGSLDIVWDEKDNHIYMTGPATFVYEGDIDL